MSIDLVLKHVRSCPIRCGTAQGRPHHGLLQIPGESVWAQGWPNVGLAAQFSVFLHSSDPAWGTRAQNHDHESHDFVTKCWTQYSGDVASIYVDYVGLYGFDVSAQDHTRSIPLTTWRSWPSMTFAMLTGALCWYEFSGIATGQGAMKFDPAKRNLHVFSTICFALRVLICSNCLTTLYIVVQNGRKKLFRTKQQCCSSLSNLRSFRPSSLQGLCQRQMYRSLQKSRGVLEIWYVQNSLCIRNMLASRQIWLEIDSILRPQRHIARDTVQAKCSETMRSWYTESMCRV